jgi:hypothetical protein
MDVTRRIRTSPHTARRDPHDGGRQLRLLARLIREVLKGQIFESFADVKPAIKAGLRQLRIRNKAHELDDALSVVTAAGACRFVAPTVQVRSVALPCYPPLSRREAAALYVTVTGRVGGAVKAMPAIRAGVIRIDGTRVDDIVDFEGQLEAPR